MFSIVASGSVSIERVDAEIKTKLYKGSEGRLPNQEIPGIREHLNIQAGTNETEATNGIFPTETRRYLKCHVSNFIGQSHSPRIR